MFKKRHWIKDWKLFNFNNKSRSFLTKLSQAFMLPIAILPFAGLMLGIGGAIGSNTLETNVAAQKTADFFKIAGVIFDNLPLLFGASVAIAFTHKNRVSAVFMFIVTFLIFLATQSIFINIENNEFKNIMYFHTNSNNRYIVGKYLGLTVLQTSIFGGVLAGAVTSFVMNRWSEIELPNYLSFFSGIRLVPMIVIPFGIVLALIFLVFWPWVGLAIALVGSQASRAPYGFDGLVYGMLGRAMMPLGLHHIVIALAFQTNLGGQLELKNIQEAATSLGVENMPDMQKFISSFVDVNKNPLTSIEGDQKIWVFLNSLNVNRLPVNTSGATLPVFEWVAKYGGASAGRYIQDYPTYLGTIQGIGLAMILAAKKSQRKKVAAVIGSSMAVAFLTGITEPLEFSFLFIAPLFYYLIYVPLSGLSYMLMKVSGAHIGVGFARGFIDYVIYGIIPLQKGTNFWVAIPIAGGLFGISFTTFFFMIKKFNWETPGRGSNEIKLIDKKEYKKLKEKEVINNEIKIGAQNKTEDIDLIVQAYGGINNISNVTACATRLRTEVKDINLVDEEIFKKMGCHGFIKKGTSTQAIFGGKAQILSSKINEKYGSKIKK